MDFEGLKKILEETQLLDFTEDAFGISDAEGKITYLNKQGKQLAKLNNGAKNGLTCSKLFNCTHIEKIPKFCPAKELPALKSENILQMVTKIGKEYYKLSCTPFYNSNNELQYILHIAKNVTEEVEKKKKLSHINSLLKALRNVNQFLYIENRPEEIFERTCQILAETQGYEYVSIFTNETTPFGKRIFYRSQLPIEFQIPESEENKIYIFLKESSNRKLLQYASLPRTQKIVTQFKTTFDEKDYFGIILPIRHKEITFGYLLVFSSAEEKFDEEETNFLIELSDELTMALYSIHINAEKEKIEREVREKERLYYTLLSNLPGFVYRCKNDRYWTMEYLSDNFYKITGYKPEEVIGNKALSFNDLIHKDHQKRIWLKWQELLKKREVFQDEYPIVTKSGEIRWVYEQGCGVYDENGNVVALEGYITDITVRKKLEEELMENAKRFRALFENSPDAIFIMAGDTYIDCNNAAAKMFNCEKRVIITKTPYQFSPKFQPDGIPSEKKAVDYIKRAYRGEELRFEWVHKTLDGYEFDCEVSLSKITYEKRSFLLAIVRDISERKRAIEEILQFRLALDSIGEAVTITDLQNKLIYANKAFEKLYGYTFEELQGKDLRILRAKESLDPRIDSDMFNTLIRNQVWRKELWNKDKSGRIFKIQLTANAILDKEGKPKGYIGVGVDLTERLLLEQTLRESEEKFRTLFSSIDDIIYTLDTKHRYSGIYGKWLQNWGLKEEDFLGKTAIEILGEEDGKIHIEMQERCLKGESVVYEWSRTLGNETFFFQTRISPITSQNGEIIGIVGVGRDITHLKKLELELYKFYQIVEQTPTGVFIIDQDGKFIYVNRSLKEIFSLSEDEVVGQTIDKLHSKVLPKEYFTELMEKAKAEGVQEIEVCLKKFTPNKWVRIRFFPIRNSDGILTNYVGLVNDFTKEKEYVKLLIESKEKAEELNSLKNYLLMNFSHEFRTPLNGILGWSKVLIDQRTEPEIKDIGEIIYKSGSRLLNTVNMLIDYSKIETGILKVQPKEFEISDLVQEIAYSQSEYYKDKELKVHFHKEFDQLIVELDEYMVRAITFALVNNAFKFTRQGEISITLRKLSLDGKGDFVELTVSDTGVGIPEDKLELIWKEFYQVSQGLSREFEGQGLGLSIAKKFTEVLGGKIFATSELGKGSTFVVQLPVKYISELSTNKGGENE
jgi:PAS domain S-box-containing protein